MYSNSDFWSENKPSGKSVLVFEKIDLPALDGGVVKW
jgi:hypothetical protein